MALSEAARQAGIAEDWRVLDAQSCDWDDTHGPQHFYLFSLKALSFISLRGGKQQICRDLLHKLEELDPRDQVGATVLRGGGPGRKAGCFWQLK